MKRLTQTYFAIFSLLLALLTGCGGERMRQRLQFVAACNEADTVFTKAWQPTVDSLVDYFRSYCSANERMTAYYLQGRVRQDLREIPQALEAYQHATEVADTTRDDCDWHTLYAVYGQMVSLFQAQFLPDNQMKALQEAERVAWKGKDTLAALVAFDLRSRPYHLKNLTDSVLIIEKQARERYLKYGYKDKAAQAILGSISILLNRRRYAEAKRYMQIFERESGWYAADGNTMAGKVLYCYDKGRYLMAMGQLDSALHYFRQTVAAGKKEAGYHGLMTFYERKNKPDSIAKYAKLYAAANDSAYLHVNQEKVQQITAMYDYTHHQHKAAEESEKARMREYAIVGILVVGLLLAAAAHARHKRYKTAKIAEINRLTADYQASKTDRDRLEKMLAAFEDTQAENEKLKQELRSEIGSLNARVQEYEARFRQVRGDERLEALRESEIASLFNQKKRHTRKNSVPSDAEWQQLAEAFAHYVPSFTATIAKEKQLSEQERRVCLLQYLDFSTGEAAILLGTTAQAVTNAKSRANHKLFSEEKASTLGRNLKKISIV
ncbi:MAG: hypothetical protein IJ605_02455 [Prevotella sp.]|nr:hypothetical protein [Prevotella sp.]